MVPSTIYTVIPVFNRLKFTVACISGLLKQTYPHHKIIVVDDGSTDGTNDYIRENFPSVTVLRGDGNLWWTGAINKAVRHVLEMSNHETDFVLTLNNDLEVEPEYLEVLLQTFKANNPCLTGSLTVDIENPEIVKFCGIKWNTLSAKYRPRVDLSLNLKDIQTKYAYVESDVLPGRGVLIPISTFSKIGLYDAKRFPHYSADEDFSIRARKAGYKLIVCPGAIVHSHFKESNLHGRYKSKNLNYWYEFFFSIRSACNLKTRFNWAVKHGRIPILYFLFDIARICGSQVRTSYITKSNS